jgi:GTP-binding protein
MSSFRVVLVGRPNVGKSALFNRLAGARRALVHDRPGMTRDALEIWAKTSTGRPYTLVDTGGLDLDAAGGFSAWTSQRALSAVADADLLVFVVDGVAGLLPEDERIGARLHALGKPVVVAWNKTDARAAAESLADAHRLGFDDVIGVSALHGSGQDELDDAIEKRLPPDLDPGTRVTPLALAIVGRPNVG